MVYRLFDLAQMEKWSYVYIIAQSIINWRYIIETNYNKKNIFLAFVKEKGFFYYLVTHYLYTQRVKIIIKIYI